MPVFTKFEANRSENMATGAKKTPKKTLWRYYVASLLRHGVYFYMIERAYAIYMFPLNLKHIGKKMRPQWPKQIFVTSRRHDVMTSRKFQTPYYTCPGHIYDVSKFEEDRLRNLREH